MTVLLMFHSKPQNMFLGVGHMHENKSKDHEGNLITEMVGLPKKLLILPHQ